MVQSECFEINPVSVPTRYHPISLLYHSVPQWSEVYSVQCYGRNKGYQHFVNTLNSAYVDRTTKWTVRKTD